MSEQIIRRLNEHNPEALLLEPRKVYDVALVDITDKPSDHWCGVACIAVRRGPRRRERREAGGHFVYLTFRVGPWINNSSSSSSYY